MGGLFSNEPKDDDFDEDVPVPDSGPEAISFFTFFRYLSPTDKVLLGVGTFSAVAAGCILPSIAIVMANVAYVFTSNDEDPTPPPQNLSMGFIASVVSIIACGLFTFSYIFFAFWQ